MFVLVDDFGRKSWVMLLKNKGEAGDRLKEWKALVETQRGLKLGRLWTDNGGEFTSVALRTWLREKGVSQEFTPPRNPTSKWGGKTNEPDPARDGEVHDAGHGTWGREMEKSFSNYAIEDR